MIQTVDELLDALEQLPAKSEVVGIYRDFILRRLVISVDDLGRVLLMEATSDEN